MPNRNRRCAADLNDGSVSRTYVDGCFWHGCLEHGTSPRTNAEWWRWKIDRNQARDQDTDELLHRKGWQVLRVWEHEEVGAAADRVQAAYAAGTA